MNTICDHVKTTWFVQRHPALCPKFFATLSNFNDLIYKSKFRLQVIDEDNHP
ncbi:hypothetical protein PN485_02730 [Nodularia spumigena CS-588/05]|nr:hypothetical protein [Nodularia spumigena CS-588/01]MDB9350932.1 hypothetical protein [Nodularia spumigena CS-588/05]